jgi:ABC-type Fe3+/spermidine/putrescine transport system ATPase subunit
VADFIGVSNLIEGKVRAVDPTRGRLSVETALGELSALQDDSFQPGEPCVLAIRPENASLAIRSENASPDGAPRADYNRLEGRISFAAYMGNTLRYDVDVGQGVTFKVDIRDPWHHASHEMASRVAVSFIASSTVAVRPD